MNKKIVSIFISMLLCVTVLSVTGTEIVDENEVMPSLEYAPSTIIPNNARYNGAFTFGEMFYGYCVYPSLLPKGPIKIPSDDPGSSESIASSSVTVYAATWALNEWYAIDDDTKAFITIDNKTGDMTIIGSTGIASSYITTGLTYDPSSDMYASAVATVGSDMYTHFYSIDMDTGVATHLSQASSPCAIISIGCDNDGNVYGPDIYDENLYLIDPITATLTLIGNTGLNLNYAQGAAYDKDEDILYLAAYGGGAGGLYTCNTTTGHATLIGNFPGGEEIAGLAIPYTLGPPPEKPEMPEGPTRGKPDVEYTYTTTTTDPDGDQVYYKWSWGDGTYSGWLGPYNSGATGTGSHSWSVLGTYDITVKAKDIHGAQSDWSDALTISIVDNEPPNKPSITGQINGKPGVTYLYIFVTIDLDGDDVYYYVDWGDGDSSGWKGPYNSGEEASATHSWTQGTYTIKVKAKDTLDDESEWGTLEVTMPVNYQRSQQSSTSLFFQILERLLTTR